MRRFSLTYHVEVGDDENPYCQREIDDNDDEKEKDEEVETALSPTVDTDREKIAAVVISIRRHRVSFDAFFLSSGFMYGGEVEPRGTSGSPYNPVTPLSSAALKSFRRQRVILHSLNLLLYLQNTTVSVSVNSCGDALLLLYHD